MQVPDPTKVSRRRIAGNATFLVVRSALSTLIGLFTSRVVLQVLGVEDYGLSAVVGSVLGVLSFLLGSLAGTCSRFITFEMGKGDAMAMKRLFSATLFIQLGLALLIVVFGETVGLWYLENRLNVAPDRMHAARWIYQLSVFGGALGVTQVPYSAVIMSYERMNVYAGFDILSMVLKLLVVYAITIVGGDKLISYSTMVFAVGVFMLILNRAYCIRRFAECRHLPKYHKETTRRIFGYCGFSILSSFCVVVCFSGTTFMINHYFGVVANAAVAIAATVHGITMLFGANIQAAFRPQIVKQYAAGNTPNVWGLACMSVKFTLLIMAVLVVPCIVEAPLVLGAWLGQVPPLSVEFLRCMLAAGWLTCISNQIDTVAYSHERIMRPTLYKCACFLANFCVIWLMFAIGAPAWVAYICNGAMYIVLSCATLSVIKRMMPQFRIRDFVTNVAMCLAVLAVSLVPVIIICTLMGSSFVRLALIAIVFAGAIIPLAWKYVLVNEERAGILTLISEKVPWLLAVYPFKLISR
ncbi:MAG: hypothetical protein JFR38_05350 [Muribaculaceae bacterium]|nr:hypothetical protein [Muribaculaceae bacterium]